MNENELQERVNFVGKSTDEAVHKILTEVINDIPIESALLALRGCYLFIFEKAKSVASEKELDNIIRCSEKDHLPWIREIYKNSFRVTEDIIVEGNNEVH